eukprot:403360402
MTPHKLQKISHIFILSFLLKLTYQKLIDIEVSRRENSILDLNRLVNQINSQTADGEVPLLVPVEGKDLINQDTNIAMREGTGTPGHGVMNLISKVRNDELIKQQTMFVNSGSPNTFSFFQATPDLSYHEKELFNYFNVQYYGKLYLGSQKKEMTFIFDTGSSWLWAPTKDCEIFQCHPSERYDPLTSTYYKVLAVSPTSIKYGTGGAQGILSQDQVCLTSDDSSCMKDYNMLSVFQTSDLQELQADGILGLAPSNQRTKSSVFVEELFKSGVIAERIFSFYISKGFSTSRVTFGGYDLKYSQTDQSGLNQTITWNNLINNNYWSLQMVQVKLGEKILEVQSNVAIVDTGTSFLLMPSRDFEKFQKYFVEQMICGIDKTYSLFTCLCTPENIENFPDIKIQLGNNLYTMPKESYIQKSGGKCYFQIMSMAFPEGQGFWILGDNFLQNYYTIFDLGQNKVGFVGAVQYQEIPKTILDYVTMVVSGVLVLVIVYVLYQLCFVKENKDDDENIYAEEENKGNFYRELAGENQSNSQSASTFLPISRGNSDLIRLNQQLGNHQISSNSNPNLSQYYNQQQQSPQKQSYRKNSQPDPQN